MELKDRIGGFISSLNIVQKIIFYIVCIHFLPYILDVIFYLFKVEFKSQSIFKWFYISADFSELIFVDRESPLENVLANVLLI